MEEERKQVIAVLPGDGIGPEIMQEALKILETAGKRHRLRYELKHGHIGGAACDRFGEPLPAETRRICLEGDAVLLGSVGGEKWDGLPQEKRPEIGGLLALRKLLGLYANIRPLTLFKELKDISPLSSSIINQGVDLVIVRELAGGIYFGRPKSLDEDEGSDTMRYSRREVRRIASLAFRMAAGRRKKVTSVDKANVLNSSMLWRRVVEETAQEYPEIELRHMYVDNAAMQLILNPRQFDVILTTNLFGDILSDESAALGGSLGMLPSVSLGETTHLYEPAGGSAPDIAGKGVANPVAMILCVALMLEYTFGEPAASKEIFYSLHETISRGFRTSDMVAGNQAAKTTREMGDAVCAILSGLDPGRMNS